MTSDQDTKAITEHQVNSDPTDKLTQTHTHTHTHRERKKVPSVTTLFFHIPYLRLEPAVGLWEIRAVC